MIMGSWGLLAFICLTAVEGHVRLDFPMARDLALDFLDNARTPGPCGMPKGDPKTTLEAGTKFNITWHLAFPHKGGFKLELLDKKGETLRNLTPDENDGFVLEDQSTQRWAVELPPNEECLACTIKLTRKAAEWGRTYRFWSCADVDIVNRGSLDGDALCLNNGKLNSFDGTCECAARFYGPRCQYENECSTDNDCQNGGRCIDIKSTTAPEKVCFCAMGYFGQSCEMSSPLSAKPDLADPSYVKMNFKGIINLYWKILDASNEIEVAMNAPTTTFMGVGFRPEGTTSSCQAFPYIGDPEYAEGEPEGESEGEPEGESEGEPEVESEGEPEGESEYEEKGKSGSEPEGESEGEPEGESEGEPEGESEYEEKGKSESEPEGESEGEPEGESEGEPEGESEYEAKSEPDDESEGEPEGESEGEPEGESEGEPEGESEDEPEGKSEGEPEGESEGEPEGESEGEPEGESEGEPEGESEGEPEGESEGEPEGESEGEPEGESEGEPEGEHKYDAEHHHNHHKHKHHRPRHLNRVHKYQPRSRLNPMDCNDIVIGMARGSYSRVYDAYTRDRSTPRRDAFFGGQEDLTAAVGFEENGETTIVFRKRLESTEDTDYSITDKKMHLIWAIGQGTSDYYHKPDSALEAGTTKVKDFYRPDEVKYHGRRNRGFAIVNFFDKPDIQGEGVQREWFRHPKGCTGIADCQYMANWKVVSGDQINIEVKGKVDDGDWVGIGFSKNQIMPQTDLVAAYFDSNGKAVIKDYFINDYIPPTEDSSQDASDVELKRRDGWTTLEFTRKLDTSDQDEDVNLKEPVHLVFPYSGGKVYGTVIGKHYNTPIISQDKLKF